MIALIHFCCFWGIIELFTEFWSRLDAVLCPHSPTINIFYIAPQSVLVRNFARTKLFANGATRQYAVSISLQPTYWKFLRSSTCPHPSLRSSFAPSSLMQRRLQYSLVTPDGTYFIKFSQRTLHIFVLYCSSTH